jgi:Alpha-L-arabinofuranosidase
MRPEYYSDLFRRYSTYCRNYDSHKLFKIASGASDYDYDWTKVLMNNVGNRMNGLSLHYYTVTGWNGSKGSATKFSNDDYYWTLGKCLEIEDVIKKHSAIMDEKDPKQRIGLLVDEWGTWWDEEPGTIKGHLFQQNTMRDAFVAALSLNVFHRHSDRVRMANIAQIANVLQSMILTDTTGNGHIVLTPTYHVFKMYQPFQDATYLPLDIKCDSMKVRDNRTIPMVSASAAKTKDGNIVISLANVSLDKAQNIDVDIEDAGIKNISGEILTSKNIGDYNDFNNPDVVKPVPFKDVKVKRNSLKVKIPAKSIVVLNIK